MLTIYDAVAWETMPKRQAVLAYLDGKYVTWPDVLALSPTRVFTVTTDGSHRADIADCESGDLTPRQAVFGVKIGLWSTIYCDLSTKPKVVDEARAQEVRWNWFAADPTGTPHLPTNAAACQYAWHSLGQCPANYDMSIATDAWVQSLTPAVPQLPEGVEVMGITVIDENRVAIDAIGAAGSPSAGHQLVFVVNHGDSTSTVIDATAGIGAKGPGSSLFTVQP